MVLATSCHNVVRGGLLLLTHVTTLGCAQTDFAKYGIGLYVKFRDAEELKLMGNSMVSAALFNSSPGASNWWLVGPANATCHTRHTCTEWW